MYLVPRHAISRPTASGVEYWDGCGFWSDLREDAEEYRTLEAAEEDAAILGGDVFSYERMSNLPDTFSKPIIQLSRARVA
jgi:hypothetical protein